jgi:uncharacterized membrane protein YgcG
VTGRRGRNRSPLLIAGVTLAFAAILLAWIAAPIAGSALTPASGGVGPSPAATPVTISGFSFQPSTISVNAQTSGSVSLSGGTAPYFLWFNNTPQGCAPPSIPVTTSSMQFQFNCQPSATGAFQVHLDVADSSTPAGHNSMSTSLTVNSNSGNGNGNNGGSGGSGGGGNGSSGFSLPSGLLQVALLLSLAFIGSMVALAAGMVATAVILSRRLRQLKEVLERTGPPPSSPPK